MSRVKIKKTDGRMTGYNDFTHVANFTGFIGSQKEFAQARRWCEEQWGPSVEYDIWEDYPELQNPAWCWERSEKNRRFICRILLNEKEAAWFALKWLS